MIVCLGCADEDKARVGLTGPRKGVLGRVTGALSLGKPAQKPAGDDSLADQWLDFLIQQADAADLAASAPPDDAVALPQQSSTQPTMPMPPQLPSQNSHNWSSLQTS